MAAVEVAAQKSWIEQNPLRRWRQTNSISMDTAASLIGVSTRSIQTWEYGTTVPSSKNLMKMREVMNNNDIVGEWSYWLNDKPGKGAA